MSTLTQSDHVFLGLPRTLEHRTSVMVTDLIQDEDRTTCPYHLRCLELRSAVSLAHNKPMEISSWGLMPQIHRINDLSIWWRRCKSGAARAHVLRKADTCFKHLPTNCDGYVLGCQDWQELLELYPGSTTPGYNGKRATATSTQHVTKITEAGFNIKQSSIYIYL